MMPAPGGSGVPADLQLYPRRGDEIMRWIVLIALMLGSGTAGAAEFVDSAGRIVQVPGRVAVGCAGSGAGHAGARGRQAAADSPPDREGGRFAGDQGAEGGPDPGLRHRLAALRGPGAGD